MARFRNPSLLAIALTAVGLAGGIYAERRVVSAWVLLAEPALLVLAVWSIAALRWRGRLPAALGLAAGTIGFSAGVRVSVPVSPPVASAPSWAGTVARCTASLSMPAAPVRLLQWTIDPGLPVEAIVGLVEAARPDVVVLHGAFDDAQVEQARSVVGGEAQVHGEAPDAVAVIASGGFHPCGEALDWSDGADAPDRYLLSFVGVPPATIFPLLAARVPSPLGPGGPERRQAATDQVAALVSALNGASTVVVAETGSPRTFQGLAGVSAAGLKSVSLPPSWPVRLGPVRTLPLHPFARMWAGPVWQVVETQALRPAAGSHAPILSVLTGLEADGSSVPSDAAEP